ncbi:MAG: S8 family serine peptidase, partial [Myxococcales bacterium]|nr:S8 family serine peptidase [Myxococcales bacterium]
MSKKLRRQIDQIIDEGTGSTRRVIVQMKVDDRELKEFLNIASSAAARRQLSISARQVLPPSAQLVRGGSRSKKQRLVRQKALKQTAQSMTSQVAAASMTMLTRQSLRALGEASLAPLVASEAFKEQVHKAGADGAKRATAPTTFWSSGSAALELEKDTLHTLPKKVSGVSDVFRNRRLRLPPVTRVDDLPREVLDHKTSAWGVEVTGALAVWGAYEVWGEGVKVAVLDTGIDPNHPDLVDGLAGWAELDVDGRLVEGSTAYDSGAHGTHCAGTIIGRNHSGKWIGMSPGAELYAGLVLKGGSGSDAQILAGLQWAIDSGVDIISMSLGGLSFEPEVHDTYTRTILNANRLGIPVVVAIGNDGQQTSGNPGNDFFAFSVGATDYRDRPAGFSGGRTQVISESRYISPQYLPLVYSKPDVSGPGVAVLSAVPGGKHEAWNGTSMATPHV